MRRQIAYTAKKIRRTIKSLKSFATKLTPVATPAPVLCTHASQLWDDLNPCLRHINVTSKTSAGPHCRATMCADRTPNTSSLPHQLNIFTWDLASSMGTRGDPPAMTNTSVDLIACDNEVWCKPSRALSYFSRKAKRSDR